MNHKQTLVWALCSLFVISCASTPPTSRIKRTPLHRTQTKAPSIPEPLPMSFEEVWEAIYQTSISYSLHDFSKEEGTVQSNWIYENPLSRYRFFITISSSETPIEWTIDVQGQERAAEQSNWKWTEPSLDKEENIQNTIYENLQKNRAS